MTTKQTLELLGMPYNKTTRLQIYRWIKRGTLKATKKSSVLDIEKSSVLALKNKIQDRPEKYYSSREVAKMLGTGIHMPERYVLKGMLTAWRTPGSPRGKWKFPRMQVLTEIEKILNSKQ